MPGPVPATAPLPPAAPWRLDLKVAAVWALLAGLSAAAVIPYMAQTMPERFARIPVSLPVLAAAQGLQALAVIGLMALLGLRMGHRVGLGSPLLARWLGGPRVAAAALRPWHSLAVGVLAALAVIGLSLLVDPLMPEPVHPPLDAGAGQSALYGFLASFYGGIAEELQLRLFLMTLLLWIVARIGKRTPRPGTYWGAIVAAALLFGAGHLQAAAQVWGLDAVVVVRTVLLNAVAGLAFGWLYWKRGLEMAVLAHFGADIVLHVVSPLLAAGA